jgi:hypothetical protein
MVQIPFRCVSDAAWGVAKVGDFFNPAGDAGLD